MNEFGFQQPAVGRIEFGPAPDTSGAIPKATHELALQGARAREQVLLGVISSLMHGFVEGGDAATAAFNKAGETLEHLGLTTR